MQTKELNDVLKNATEVTSLASTDRLAVIGGAGVLKKINGHVGVSKDFYNVPEGSWIRIGVASEHSKSAFVLFSAIQSWSNSRPGSILVAATFGSADYGDCYTHGAINILSGTNKACFPKARFVCPSSNTGGVIYLDLYMAANNPVNSISVISKQNFNVEISQTATIPEGYSTKEFDLTTVEGGGKLLSFNQLHKYTERRWVA